MDFVKHMISFIVPFKDNRSHLLPSFLKQVKTYYKDFEIIIARQDDNKPFMRGQLCNLGYKRSKGSLVVFSDVDIMFLDYIDFEGDMKKLQHPFICYKAIYQADKKGNIRTSTHGGKSVGGLNCFTREQFEACGGFSNLCIGYGTEDRILDVRAKFKRAENIIAHIKHEKQIQDKKLIAANKQIFRTLNERPVLTDSFLQTVALKETIKKLSITIPFYLFEDITVTPDFAYPQLLKGRI